MENDFLKTLKQNPAKSYNKQSLQILDQFCQSIEDFTNQRLVCRREPGFATNFGQEWRVIMQPAEHSYQQVLLRAYVPLDGYPVQIDLYAGEMKTCASEASLRRALNDFLKQPTVQETIAYLQNSSVV